MDPENPEDPSCTALDSNLRGVHSKDDRATFTDSAWTSSVGEKGALFARHAGMRGVYIYAPTRACTWPAVGLIYGNWRNRDGH